jgi:3-hydroxyacyl-CoA dehydrogenase/enoyl-CoA hydratase/3-hydroxybutyryl-CoA epimerase/enoyl-CoA isomerase
MFQGLSLRLTELGDGIVELCFDRPGESVNKFDRQTVAELQQVTGLLAQQPGLRGVLVSSAKDSFIVGADIFEFSAMFSQSVPEVEAENSRQASAFTAFSDLPVPTAVAINGMAFGGGFEMALACDQRFIADSASIGLPEVTLGIVPAYGGSVRLPRVAGCATALNWVTSGTPRKAAAALTDGAVDVVLPAEQLRDGALAWLRQAAAGQHDWQTRRQRTRGPVALDAAAMEQARTSAARTAKHFPAAAGFVQFMADTAALDAPAAAVEEARLFARLATTPTAAALVRLFTNDQFLKKKAKGYVKAARPLKQAAVLGAGIMGGGIAYTSAVRGTPVLMKDIADAALQLGMGEADKLLAKQVDGGRMAPEKAAKIRASIQPQLDFAGFDSVDIVVEAIVENLGIKKKVLAELEGLVRSDAVIASNTSSLSIGDMASALQRPQNFVGMHFFNPVPLMPLVEVICGERTDPVAAATVAGYALAMGKTPVVVKDCPGFLVNRCITPYSIGFLRLVHDGADFRQVDVVMEAFGWPMGPAYLDDVIGMDTLAHVLDVIAGGYGARMVPDFPTAVHLLAQHKRLGQKSGGGFYRYENDAKGRPRKLEDPEALSLIASVQPNGPRSFTEQEVIDRLMLPMVLEAARCLDEGVAESAVEVDMGMVLGLGFPRHLGGPLHWADQIGLPEIVRRCTALAAVSSIYRPSDAFVARAAAGGRFHA